MMEMDHDALLENLAQVKGTIFKNPCLGSPVLASMEGELIKTGKRWKYKRNGVPRADIIVIRPSYTRFLITTYEIKSNRADFLSEMRTGKWKKYFPHCHRFYFAMPKGVANKKEIPEEAGLLLYGEKGWYVAKMAKVRDVEIPTETLLALLFYRMKFDRHRPELSRMNSLKDAWSFEPNLRKLGKKISKAIEHHNRCENGYCEKRRKHIDKT